MEFSELDVIKPSRKKQEPGDIFVFKPNGRDFYFGRVIKTDAQIASFENCILIYLYKAHASQMGDVPRLELNNLLLPPVITNKLPWSRGYFLTVGNRPLEKSEVLHVHCFKRFNGRYYDEYSNELDAAIEPVGEFGLASYAILGEEIGKALAC